MTVTFDDVLLADGEARTMRVASGLAPSGEVAVDPLEFLRADWAVPVARGNRLMTLPMVIEFPACDTFEEALIESLMYFKNLPEEGTLVIAHASRSVTWEAAVCSRCSQLQAIEGLSNGVQLNFVLGQPVNATLSPLAQMDARYIANLSAVVGLTGGGSTKLDGQVTADVSVGFTTFLPLLLISSVAVPKMMHLITDPDPGVTPENVDPSAGLVIIKPDDYHATTNPKLWVEKL